MRMGSPGTVNSAALHQTQNFFTPEIIRGLRAHIAPRADFNDAAPHFPDRLDLLPENAFEFRIQIIRQQPLARRELQSIRKRQVELLENRYPDIPGPGELPVKLRGQALEQFFVRRGMQPAKAREIG
jgi:hypothetical protein